MCAVYHFLRKTSVFIASKFRFIFLLFSYYSSCVIYRYHTCPKFKNRSSTFLHFLKLDNKKHPVQQGTVNQQI